MGFLIKCTDRHCGHQDTWADDIIDLIQNHTNERGWFLCECGKNGYINNDFFLQEGGDIWKPYLMGAIKLGNNNVNYQPLALLASSNPYHYSAPTDIWLSYYRDLRQSGGPLTIGHGYRIQAVLNKYHILNLVKCLTSIGCLTPDELNDLKIHNG